MRRSRAPMQPAVLGGGGHPHPACGVPRGMQRQRSRSRGCSSSNSHSHSNSSGPTPRLSSPAHSNRGDSRRISVLRLLPGSSMRPRMHALSRAVSVRCRQSSWQQSSDRQTQRHALVPHLATKHSRWVASSRSQLQSSAARSRQRLGSSLSSRQWRKRCRHGSQSCHGSHRLCCNHCQLMAGSAWCRSSCPPCRLKRSLRLHS